MHPRGIRPSTHRDVRNRPPPPPPRTGARAAPARARQSRPGPAERAEQVERRRAGLPRHLVQRVLQAHGRKKGQVFVPRLRADVELLEGRNALAHHARKRFALGGGRSGRRAPAHKGVRAAQRVAAEGAQRLRGLGAHGARAGREEPRGRVHALQVLPLRLEPARKVAAVGIGAGVAALHQQRARPVPRPACVLLRAQAAEVRIGLVHPLPRGAQHVRGIRKVPAQRRLQIRKARGVGRAAAVEHARLGHKGREVVRKVGDSLQALPIHGKEVVPHVFDPKGAAERQGAPGCRDKVQVHIGNRALAAGDKGAVGDQQAHILRKLPGDKARHVLGIALVSGHLLPSRFGCRKKCTMKRARFQSSAGGKSPPPAALAQNFCKQDCARIRELIE